jgi:DNA primase
MTGKKFSDQLIESVRNKTDLVAVISEYLSLKKSGQNFTGLCPFHAEKSPSFSVNPAKQFFHCFGCSAGGDVFHFLSKMDQISFPEAVRRLAQKAGVSIPSEKEDRAEISEKEREMDEIYQLNEQAAFLFHQHLMDKPEAAAARAYLAERGISQEMIDTFSIGFAIPRGGMIQRLKCPESLLEKGCLIRKGETGPYDYFRNRIIFPIKRLSGKIAGFGGRALDDTPPKYLNTSETPVFTKGKNLFGLNLARGKKSLIVVEGYFDAISLYQAGITNVVATLGTALTGDHLRLIRRFVEKATLLFDPDRAGIDAVLRAAPLFVENEMTAEVVSLPSGEDPDLFIRRQGKAAFQKKIESGELIIPFVIWQTALSSPGSIADKTKAIRSLFPLIRKIPNQMERGRYFKSISDAFGMAERDVLADFEKEKNKAIVYDRVSTGVVASSAFPVQKVRLPEDEQTLLALLVQDQLDIALLSPLFPDDFTTPQVKNIVHYFWNAEGRSWVHPDALADRILDSDRSLFSALAVLEIAHENRDEQITDCVKSLKKKRLLRDTIKIQTQIKLAEKGGDRAAAASLQHVFFSLKKELSHIGL